MFLKADRERRQPKRSSRAGCGAMPLHGIIAVISVEAKMGGFYPISLCLPQPPIRLSPQLCSGIPTSALVRHFEPQGEAEPTEQQQYVRGEDLLLGPCLHLGLALISAPWRGSGSVPEPCSSCKLQEPWSKGSSAKAPSPMETSELRQGSVGTTAIGRAGLTTAKER